MVSEEDKRAFLSMSLDDKIKRTKQLILEWYLQFDGKVYVSFSGGKDSTVLLHIARSIKGCEDIAGVFSDTGLEYPEIRDFVKKQDNIIWIKPKLTFKQVIEKYGYPVISKEQSRNIYEIKTTKSKKLLEKRLGSGMSALSKKWRPLLDADFKIGNQCCSVMKKRPFQIFERKTGLHPIVGIMAEESLLRMNSYMRGECNQFSSKHPVSHPLFFWSNQDILQYIKLNNLEMCSVYGDIIEKDGKLMTTGCQRTGCMFCMYGVHLEPVGDTRFDKMKVTHPKQYDYIMNKLNGKHVLNAYLACDAKHQEPKLL